MAIGPSPGRTALAGSRSALPDELVPQRLAELRVPEGSSLLVIHGAAPRVSDNFIDAALDVLDIEQTMWVWARAAGFERVLFSGRGKAAYSLDGEWERLLQTGTPAGARPRAAREPRFAGPLGRRWLVPTAVLAPPAPPRHEAAQLTDLAAVDLLDATMRNDATRTALVFLQAEHWLRFNEARRTFAETLTRWVESPPRSGSLCVLVFRYEDLGDVLAFAALAEYPALHAALTAAYVGHAGYAPTSPAFRLGPPGRPELEGLLHLHRLTHGLRLEDWTELPALLRAMAASRVTLRAWESRFRILEGRDPGEPGPLSLQQLRARFWIPAHAAEGGSASDRLKAMTGLADVKKSIDVIAATVRQQRRQGTQSGRSPGARLNFVFTGNPGTGKTTVARLMGELLRDLGALPEGHLYELSPRALGAVNPGQARQAIHDAMLRARGGVLFIDEAYQLSDERSGFGQDAITALNQLTDNERGRTSVIVAGYHGPMQNFLRANPGLPDRFPRQYRIEFPDFSAAELLEVLLRQLTDRGLSWTPKVQADLAEVVSAMHAERADDFGNARAMENLADSIFGRHSVRMPPPESPLTADDIPVELRPPDRRATGERSAQALRQLDALVGLASVKQVLHTLVDRLNVERRRRQLDLPTSGLVVPHMVFAGPPGTGKTTVAFTLGEILHAMGLLRTGRVHTATRTNLVAEYVGQTGPRTRNVILNALGGVLFIDEAHTLIKQEGSGRDFGREALDELALQMERYRGQFVVVAAGYPERMDALLDHDPGLRGRFGLTVPFTFYSDAELVEILRRMVATDFAALSDDVVTRATRWISAQRARLGPEFDNARAIRRLVDQVKDQQAGRLARLAEPTVQDLRTFLAQDVPDA